ncbi:hypothetical protein SHIRM173S_00135 [Streptomyces hirsutus]
MGTWGSSHCKYYERVTSTPIREIHPWLEIALARSEFVWGAVDGSCSCTDSRTGSRATSGTPRDPRDCRCDDVLCCGLAGAGGWTARSGKRIGATGKGSTGSASAIPAGAALRVLVCVPRRRLRVRTRASPRTLVACGGSSSRVCRGEALRCGTGGTGRSRSAGVRPSRR